MTARRTFLAAAVAALSFAVGQQASAATVAEADSTVKIFKATDPGLATHFDKAAGYAVFPGVGKGGLGIGGAHGSGIVYEAGKPVGETSLTQVSIGAQIGGEEFSEVIFFKTDESLQRFKSGNFEFAGDVSAVALRAGASASAKYEQGVAVVTATKGGLMLQAAIGGQKFSYKPLKEKPTG